MTTAIGYLLIAVAILVIRQVAVGRTDELPGDIRDFVVGLTTGDMAAVGEVSKRRGENVPASSLGDAGTPPIGLQDYPGMSVRNAAFARAVMQLGDSARGYKWGAEGPDYYDCSGIIWAALRHANIYRGSRFTTSSFPGIASNFAAQVSSPQPGDIVLWRGKHMGVYIGNGDYYSARSVSKGIGVSDMSGDAAYFGSPPTYWRIIK